MGLRVYAHNVTFHTVTVHEVTGRGKFADGVTPTPPQDPHPGPLAKGEVAKAWNTPEFQAWVAETQKLPAEKQVEAVATKLVELNPGFDGKVTGVDAKGNGIGTPKIENGVVTEFGFVNTGVTDISPVRALVGLTVLRCSGKPYSTNSKLSDLSPLQGMTLKSLNCGNAQVSDLSPLQGMPLTELRCGYTKALSDLSPLKGMPLTFLACYGTQVSDLSPLEDCKSLKSLSVKSTPVTAAGVAALKSALPNCKISWDDPAKAKAPQPDDSDSN